MDDRSLLPKLEPSKGCTNQVSIPLPLPDDTQSTSSEGSSRNGENYERGNWGKQLDFFLSCVGYAVGLGNVWRFPYLCYRSGGGAFLVPYILFLVICGMPLFFLELSFGQFASLGPVAIWKISPLFKGLGYGMVIISGIVCIYYNVIIAWTLYYIYQSLTSLLPWSTCNNWWNTPNCVDRHYDPTASLNSTGITNSSVLINGTVAANETIKNFEVNNDRITSSEEFWVKYVLRLTSGIHDLGEVQWPLVLTLFIAWVVVFLCLMKGVKSSGKVVYVSATFPYIVLVILLIRGVTLPGAWKGIVFYLTPRWELLMSFKVWGDAATQIFYSVGAAWGAVLTMASYNRFSNNCYRDSLLIPIINCSTSIFAGLVVFSIIGYMSYETGKPIEEVVSQGPGLAFVVYPEAVSRLPLSPLWALLFFFMLFTIGLDSQQLLTFQRRYEITVFSSSYNRPKLYIKKNFFLHIFPYIKGLYEEIDKETRKINIKLSPKYEKLSCRIKAKQATKKKKKPQEETKNVVYKTPCICNSTKFYTGKTKRKLKGLLIFIVINHSPVTYNDYEYPDWSIALGWMMAVLPLIPIPLFAGIQIYKSKGSLSQRILVNLRPSPEWGPATEENRLLYKKSLSIVSSNFRQTHVAGLSHSESQVSCGKVSMNTADALPAPSDDIPLQSESVV
ncbi:sodium- and chloride-dependent glycine transporter 1-like [Centruroides sculpturatus]|uniref:sodium- and chloride-dependent glycine transporter 1-like n=1 Tax=Centruroides sculpturatus TaxID=218467 RepID=UPI000C6CBCDB|nr:sodium- and chloride-dependent glycine transporter 1-like [Centruroides sculpturatus]